MTGGGIVECNCRTRRHAIHSSEHADITTEIVDHIPDPWFAIKSICSFPDGLYLSSEIKQDHVLIGHCIEQGFYLRSFPKFPVTVKQPSLHNPDGFGVCRHHTLI